MAIFHNIEDELLPDLAKLIEFRFDRFTTRASLEFSTYMYAAKECVSIDSHNFERVCVRYLRHQCTNYDKLWRERYEIDSSKEARCYVFAIKMIILSTIACRFPYLRRAARWQSKTSLTFDMYYKFLGSIRNIQ